MDLKRTLLAMLLICPLGAWAASALEKSQQDEVITIPNDDPAMARAIVHARSTLTQFFDTAATAPAGSEGFAVKVGVTEGEHTEFFWITPFEATEEGRFHGIISNQPRIVTSVAKGQLLAFSRGEIVDWLYYEQGRMRGNFTACALLSHEPEASRREYIAAYGLECDF